MTNDHRDLIRIPSQMHVATECRKVQSVFGREQIAAAAAAAAP